MPSKTKLVSEVHELQHRRKASTTVLVSVNFTKNNASVIKTGHTNDASGNAFGFVGSNPDTITQIGELIADAGKLAKTRLEEVNGNQKA